MTPIERQRLNRLQTAIKTVRREYYKDVRKNNERNVASALAMQRLIKFMHNQWEIYDS